MLNHVNKPFTIVRTVHWT